MLYTLFASKTRVKLLCRLFLNSESSCYLRSFEPDFNESSNTIRQEINILEPAGLLVAHWSGNKKIYMANTAHTLFPEINNLVRKHLGIYEIYTNICLPLVHSEAIYLTGLLAKGLESDYVNLIIVNGKQNIHILHSLIRKTASLICKKIDYSIISLEELSDFLSSCIKEDRLLLWKPHQYFPNSQ